MFEINSKRFWFLIFSDKLSEEQKVEEGKEKEKEIEKKKRDVKKDGAGEKPGYCDCCSLRYKDLNKV